MKKKKKLTSGEWEELASLLSEEKEHNNSELFDHFLAEDALNTEKHWKGLKMMDDNKEINVDQAWERLYSRMNENSIVNELPVIKNIPRGIPLLRIAATLLILVSIGSGLIYLNNKGIFGGLTTINTGSEKQNVKVGLPDGSTVYLNRNTKISYYKDTQKHGRKVILSGEAFFDITPDEANPFSVDAGNAEIKVLGTSFNVITINDNSEVEVFVQTGKVILTDNSGSQNLVLDPGYIGKVSPGQTEKKLNTNPNYLSWNTGRLVYTGQELGIVFSDLTKVYGIEIYTDDATILEHSITSTFENQSHETIILVICTTFNLSFTKDGDVYHLSRK